MSTLTRSESSRINGAKSHGPVTPEGKQRSSMNAVKHGILAKHICLNIEKPEVFEQIVADFSTRLQPADDVELRLVEQAAMAQLRYERVAASSETAMFVLKMDYQAPEVAKQYERVDPPTRFAIAFTALGAEGNSIQLMLRYQQTMLRQRDSAMKQLHELRTKFPAPNEPESPEPVESTKPAPAPNEPDAPAAPAMLDLKRSIVSGRGSAWLERLVRDQEVGGSNPLAPTNPSNRLQSTKGFLDFICDVLCDIAPLGWHRFVAFAVRNPGRTFEQIALQS